MKVEKISTLFLLFAYFLLEPVFLYSAFTETGVEAAIFWTNAVGYPVIIIGCLWLIWTVKLLSARAAANAAETNGG